MDDLNGGLGRNLSWILYKSIDVQLSGHLVDNLMDKLRSYVWIQLVNEINGRLHVELEDPLIYGLLSSMENTDV